MNECKEKGRTHQGHNRMPKNITEAVKEVAESHLDGNWSFMLLPQFQDPQGRYYLPSQSPSKDLRNAANKFSRKLCRPEKKTEKRRKA
jgi:hypothetical protein